MTSCFLQGVYEDYHCNYTHMHAVNSQMHLNLTIRQHLMILSPIKVGMCRSDSQLYGHVVQPISITQ